MAQQQPSSGIMSGAITVLGLAFVWMTIATNFPALEELSPAAVPAQTRQAVRPSSAVAAAAGPVLTIPPPSPLPSTAPVSRPDDDQARRSIVEPSVVRRSDPRGMQASRLKCEAEIVRLCPDSSDGSGRSRCLEQRAKEFPSTCQSQLHDRFVKWRESRSRLMAACDEEVARFCRAVTPGKGQILQCLQSHVEEVSERCYDTLPKGTLFFR